MARSHAKAASSGIQWTISLSQSSATEDCGTDIPLTATVYRDGVVVSSGFTLTWSSSDTNIATISADGSSCTVSSYNGGSAQITATIDGTSVSGSCGITYNGERTRYALSTTSSTSVFAEKEMYSKLGGNTGIAYVRKLTESYSNGAWTISLNEGVSSANFTVVDNDGLFNNVQKTGSYINCLAKGATTDYVGNGTLTLTFINDGNKTLTVPYFIDYNYYIQIVIWDISTDNIPYSSGSITGRALSYEGINFWIWKSAASASSNPGSPYISVIKNKSYITIKSCASSKSTVGTIAAGTYVSSSADRSFRFRASGSTTVSATLTINGHDFSAQSVSLTVTVN